MTDPKRDFCVPGKARNPEGLDPHVLRQYQASPDAEREACQGILQRAETRNSDEKSWTAITQRRYMRDVRIRRLLRDQFEAGVFAEVMLAGHIHASFPFHLRASEAIGPRILYAVHYRAAEFAYRQVRRLVRRHGLKQIVDRSSFFHQHIRWYGLFCSFSLLVRNVFGWSQRCT